MHYIVKNVRVCLDLFPGPLHANNTDFPTALGGKRKITERDKTILMSVATGRNEKIGFFDDRDPQRPSEFLERPHQKF